MSFNMVKYIFKSFVCETVLPDIDNNELAKYIYKLKQSSPGVIISNYNGWQSENIAGNNPSHVSREIFKLLNNVNQVVDPLKKEFDLKPDLQLSLANLWLNVNPKSGFNAPHVHEGILSGVYYVASKKNSGNIIFKNPAVNLSYHCREDFVYSHNEVNSSSWWFSPKPGLLLIFPSWLEHYVQPNLNDEDRISISFNIIVSKT